MTSKRKTKKEPWHKWRDKRRTANTLPIHKRYLIVTEGETEAIYFRNYHRIPTVSVEVVDPPGNRRALVERAEELREQYARTDGWIEGTDEVWVVMDRDVDPNNPIDKGQFNEAIQLAESRGMGVAYSNDSFELWFLLHFQEVSAAMHRADMRKRLTKHLGTHYEKTVDLYARLRDGRADAIKRAKRMHKASDENPEASNPCTTVHVLVEKLMNEKGFKELD